MSLLSSDLVWWITAFDLPALAGLFWMNWKARRDFDAEARFLRERLETRHSQMREALASFKLEVAKGYSRPHALGRGVGKSDRMKLHL